MSTYKAQDIDVLLFAQAAETAKTRSITLTLDLPAKVQHVRDKLIELRPELAKLAECSRWAVNEQFIELEDDLPSSDSTDILEVAMIPPVSGG